MKLLHRRTLALILALVLLTAALGAPAEEPRMWRPRAGPQPMASPPVNPRSMNPRPMNPRPMNSPPATLRPANGQ